MTAQDRLRDNMTDIVVKCREIVSLATDSLDTSTLQHIDELDRIVESTFRIVRGTAHILGDEVEGITDREEP